MVWGRAMLPWQRRRSNTTTTTQRPHCSWLHSAAQLARPKNTGICQTKRQTCSIQPDHSGNFCLTWKCNPIEGCHLTTLHPLLQFRIMLLTEVIWCAGRAEEGIVCMFGLRMWKYISTEGRHGLRHSQQPMIFHLQNHPDNLYNKLINPSRYVSLWRSITNDTDSPSWTWQHTWHLPLFWIHTSKEHSGGCGHPPLTLEHAVAGRADHVDADVRHGSGLQRVHHDPLSAAELLTRHELQTTSRRPGLLTWRTKVRISRER